jgi:hypothetical protein
MSRRFTGRRLAQIDVGRVLWIRAGRRAGHRFIGIWAVVVSGRVYVRSWSLKESGWYRTFLIDPLGAIQLGDDNVEVKVRAVRVRSDRIRDAVERGYALKYATPGSRRYVRGFRSKRRREATLELIPR